MSNSNVATADVPDAVRAVLAKVTDEAAAVEALTASGHSETDAKRYVREWQAQQASKYGAVAPIEPEDFDFDADAPEPDWIVTGLLERHTVNVLSGDTGAAKSIHAKDAAVRLVTGRPWLGREVPRRRPGR